MSVKELASKLHKIPHLQLPFYWNVQSLIRDWELVREHQIVYRSPTDTDQFRAAQVTKHWRSIPIYSMEGRDDRDLLETSFGTSLGYKPTKFGKQTEYFQHVNKELGGGLNRVSAMVMTPGGQTSWHSHVHRYRGVVKAAADPESIKISEEIVIHVPIISPPKFKFSVIHIRDFQFHDFSQPVAQYDQYYGAGETWIFNTFHYHNVFNHDTQDRVSLMLHLSLHNKKIYNVVEKAVDEYKGPLLPKVEVI